MFEAFNDFDEHQDKYGTQCNVVEFDEARIMLTNIMQIDTGCAN
jgi:hypothetical protein